MKINVNGIEMYYEKYGAGRPLVLVHGNSMDHTVFKDSIWLLRRHFTVYAVDSRGHGLSTKVDELHYTDMADDMAAFMDQLDLRDVVGSHSMAQSRSQSNIFIHQRPEDADDADRAEYHA